MLAAATLIAGVLEGSVRVAPPRHVTHLLPRFTSAVALPAGYAPPPAPKSNPVTAEKIELGRYLFYEKRLSRNGTQSCASCHQQRFAFCDGRAHAIGSTGREHHRNTMSLVNVGYRRPLTWSNAKVVSLEQQVLIPLTNRHPIEMGMRGRLAELPRRLRDDAEYRRMFAAAFPGEPITVRNIAKAIASFERSIVSADSPYDRLVHRGDAHALSAEAWRGRQLFFAKCAGCHGGADFATPLSGSRFRRNRVTRGTFRVPTLRNVALTAPYMHDGSIATLDEVVARYGKVRGLRSDEQHAVVAFLVSLTDESVTTNPKLSDPHTWVVDVRHSDVSFRIRHLMSQVRGRFTRFSGTITSSNVAFTIEAASIDTNEPERDDDLRSENFFNVAKYPQITFKSSAIKEVSKDRYEVTGNLTMHGVTKQLTLAVTFLGVANDPFGGTKAGFELTTTLRRSDFGITWNHSLDSGGVLLGDEVAVSIALEANGSIANVAPAASRHQTQNARYLVH
jgi:cytochrome c peroxidase